MTRLPRRAILAASLLPLPALAQGDRPIRLVVPFAAGGGADVMGRLLAEAMAARLDQPVVVENRPGASGILGAEAVVRAAPDGQTLLLGSVGAISIQPHLVRMSFDPLADLTPLAPVAGGPAFLLVNPTVPADSVATLEAAIRARPGHYAFASSGPGTSAHMIFAGWAAARQLDVTLVPYRDNAPRVADLLTGRAHIALDVLSGWAGPLAERQMRLLAVSTARRWPTLPELPTAAEAGAPELGFSSWFGLFSPAGTPVALRARLGEAATAALAEPGLRARLIALGFEPDLVAPDEFPAFLQAEARRWGMLAAPR